MKRILLLLISTPFFIGCQSRSDEAETQAISLPTKPTLAVTQTDSLVQATANKDDDESVDWKNLETIDWESLRINGKLPLLTKVSSVHRLLGKADSVTQHHPEACPSFFNTDDSRLSYYDGYHFEQSGDSIVFIHVDFRENKNAFLQNNDMKLNSATTLEELKRRFPNAVKGIKEVDFYDMENVDYIRLRHANPVVDGSWLLLIQDRKLIMVKEVSPC
jgi:hypothetical protein